MVSLIVMTQMLLVPVLGALWLGIRNERLKCEMVLRVAKERGQRRRRIR